MSNGFRWELLSQQDGEAVLSHWDIDGRDVVIVLTVDNQAFIRNWANPDNLDDDTEIRTPIDLVAYLRQFAETMTRR